MSLANPAGDAAAAAPSYTRAVLALLGDRDPLAVLAETPDALAAAVADLDEADLHRPEAPGKWSIAAVLRHLADTEMVYAWRLRLILGQLAGGPPPTLTGFDQDSWAMRFRYDEADCSEALADHRAVRAANLRLLRSASADQLAQVGLHSERGPESGLHTLRLQAGHDLAHRRQIARIRAGLGRPAASG